MVLLIPKRFPMTSTFPSKLTVTIGLIFAISPMAAVVLETRPPLHKYSSVSTAAKILICERISSR